MNIQKKKKKSQASAFVTTKDNLMKEAVRRGTKVTAAVSVGICLLLAFGFYWLFLGDLLSTKKAFEAKVEAKEAENLRGQAIEKSQPLFEEEFRKLISITTAAEPLLPNETQLSEMLAGVQDIARRNNVTLTGMTAVKPSQKATLTYYDEKGEVKTADKVYEREIPAQVAGDYPNVVRFFYDLKILERIIVVRDFALYAKEGNRVAANFTLMIYHAPPPSEMKPLPDFINKNQVAQLNR